MTARTVRLYREPQQRPRLPDFASLTCEEAKRRVCWMRASGWAEYSIATLVGWHVSDVRWALAERCARPS